MNSLLNIICLICLFISKFLSIRLYKYARLFLYFMILRLQVMEYKSKLLYKNQLINLVVPWITEDFSVKLVSVACVVRAQASNYYYTFSYEFTQPICSSVKNKNSNPYLLLPFIISPKHLPNNCKIFLTKQLCTSIFVLPAIYWLGGECETTRKVEHQLRCCIDRDTN